MQEFTAQLTKDVEYRTFSGNRVKVPKGQIVSVLRTDEPQEAMTVSGETDVQPANSFIATAAGVSFDIEAGDFNSVHAC